MNDSVSEHASLEPPRWPGGPEICPVANLPAFESKSSAATFRETNSPGGTVIAEWVCVACGKVHFWGAGFDASGASSGTTRTVKHIESVTARFYASPVAKTIPRKIEI